MPGGHLAHQATIADSGSMSFTLVGSERPRVVYMILKLAFESQPEPEPEVEVVEPAKPTYVVLVSCC